MPKKTAHFFTYIYKYLNISMHNTHTHKYTYIYSFFSIQKTLFFETEWYGNINNIFIHKHTQRHTAQFDCNKN